MTRLNLILLASCLILCSCNKKQRVFQSSDRELAVQIMAVNETGDKLESSYRVRLIPEHKLFAALNEDDKKKLWYKVDSCFYMAINNKAVYPVFLQPVANGITGSFEYLVEFDRVAKNEPGLQMVYKDKYLSHKKYSIKLN